MLFVHRQTEAKDRVLNDNNVNANVVAPREKETNQVEMSPKKRKVQRDLLPGQAISWTWDSLRLISKNVKLEMRPELRIVPDFVFSVK